MNIGNLQIIQTLIALVICWALFAITCSMVNELLSKARADRGKFMKKYLLQQLRDDSNGINWASLLYVNGGVDMLSRSANKPSSEIPSPLFARTLIEAIGSSNIVQSQANSVQPSFANITLKNFDIAMKVLNASDVVDFLRQSFNNAILAGTDAGLGIDEQKVYSALVQNIETWYNALQGRLTLWYKKKTRVSLFAVGLSLALLLNIDSVQLFGTLNKEEKSRSALITYYLAHKPELEALGNRHLATDTNANNSSNQSMAVTKTEKAPSSLQAADTALLKSIDSVNAWTKKMDSLANAALLPIGVRYSVFVAKPQAENPLIWYFLKILGLLISGLAASVGAPYWFDLLKKTTSTKI